MRYFMVTAKCGHVGKDFYIPIDFPVRAESAKEAAATARFLPRVKHHHKDAILSVEEVSYADYEDLRYVNSFDPYLQCHCIQDQRLEYDAVYSRIREEVRDERRPARTCSVRPIYSGKERIRNARRYAKEQAAYGMLEAI